ncbi:RsmB/NOP family class I SAM-dependent RNA methyltransferase [Roseovarius autotrophicus]|uniref:RsmB/NOP family class I SAM-dependent RNA methyltransferase n=1 Tax=Roseovarius autotrophicus TaxID=2824121 RepID=UPI001B3895BF|nr:RsmB/NOP family class I SAM-dependent RNA methyltransferase [Roseovarius autotrophicus]
MTPGARVAAAIVVLDSVLEGAPAERALTNWARAARYAGSGDRAAVRDHVFGALRCLRSFSALGGGGDGRALMIGSLRAQGIDPDIVFTGQGHGPAPLSDIEKGGGHTPSEAEARDLPDWLWPYFEASLGPKAAATAEALRHRAPVTLRVNARRITREAAQDRLSREGIGTRAVEGASFALQVLEGVRKISRSMLYREGLVELQDASSQAAMEAIALPEGARVLDYCAGGGGKTLALAARLDCDWFAHDAELRRMTDLPARAARAGVHIRLCDTRELDALAPFDAVLCDVPCSGSGTWRRAPQAKWALTPDRLRELTGIQKDILRRAAALLAPTGVLIYATCSVFRLENEDVVGKASGAAPGWSRRTCRRWQVDAEGDGFFLAHLWRE